ncbi:NAD(P)/FAD-dependent oxidoreductase [Roseobacteraceae bacterium S113]
MSDILIIGGGIAGVSAAAELAPHAAVTLLEAEDNLAYHASGRSAAAFVPGYGNAVIQGLTEASAAHLHETGVLAQRGMMMLARPGEEDGFSAEASDFGLHEISFDEAVRCVPVLRPEAVARVGVKDAVWDVDTDALIQSYARTARAAGAQIVTKAQVSDITREANGWRVQAGESYHAPLLINAAGAWADAIATQAGVAPLGIVPHRRSMARVAAPEGVDVSGWPFLDGVAERWYAKPDAGALIISPADEEPIAAMDAWAEDETLALGIERYSEMVTTPVERMVSNWAGLRSFAPDRALVLGRDAREPAFIWCAGQGGYGFQTGPGAARLIRDLVLDRSPDLDSALVSALAPGRFAP